MLDKIKEILKRQPELSCYMVAKILGVDTRSMSVAKNYWKARALLMEELTGKTLETILENTGHWTDKEGQVYVKDNQFLSETKESFQHWTKPKRSLDFCIVFIEPYLKTFCGDTSSVNSRVFVGVNETGSLCR